MSNKNVITTPIAVKVILNTLNDDNKILYLSDEEGNKLLLDDGAVTILKAYYTSKRLEEEERNG